jgi:hypothetical protein
MRPMAKETHIKTDKKNRWRLGCLGVTYFDDKRHIHLKRRLRNGILHIIINE